MTTFAHGFWTGAAVFGIAGLVVMYYAKDKVESIISSNAGLIAKTEAKLNALKSLVKK